MVKLTEIGGSEAEIERLSTAPVTLPSDVFVAMLRAIIYTSANLLYSALFANQVLFLSCLCSLHVSFAVNLATVVGLLTGMTLVKSACFHHELDWLFSEPLAVRICERRGIDNVRV